jgi:hypothetical protein
MLASVPAADWFDYVPLATTALAAAFVVALFRHWRRRQGALHLLWWMIGVAFFGIAVLAEAIVTLGGWEPWLFRTWYISGALLGGAPLAQGTVYLLVDRRRAHALAVGLVAYASVAAVLVLLTPLSPDPSDPQALTGRVMEWGWIRALTPALNLYAVVFLVGGAAWSAIRYWRSGVGSRRRPVGNALIAAGAIAPALRGMVTRMGMADTVFVTELVGLALIFIGYRLIVGEPRSSEHATGGA